MEKKLVIYIAWSLILSVLSPSAFSLSRQPSFQTLNESIHALNITKNKSLKSLDQLNSVQNKILYNEYSVFIEFLSFRITKYCQQISEYYGESSLKGLPCPRTISHIQNIDKNTYRTADENIESLDDELMNALGDFDEMLLEEHENIAQISQKKLSDKGSVSSLSEGGNGSKKIKKEMKGDEEKEKSDQTQNSKQSEKNTNKKSKGNQSGNRNYKKRKIDQSDDDIVARQLKEAAENETDPELKEKLWIEYEKYKQNINVK